MDVTNDARNYGTGRGVPTPRAAAGSSDSDTDRLARALGHMLTCPEPQSSHAGMPGGEMRGRSHVRRNSPKSGATVAFAQPTAGFCTPVATCLYCIAAHRRRAGSVGIVVTNKLLALRARSFAVLNLRCRDQCNGFAVESTVQSSRVTATRPRYPAVRSELEHCEPLPLRVPLARSRPPRPSAIRLVK